MSHATGSTDPSSISAAPGGYGPPPGGYGSGGFGPPGAPPPGGFGAPPPGGFGAPPGGFGGPPPGGYGGPDFNSPAGGGGPFERAEAENKVKPPAITLMIFTVVGVLLQLFSLAVNVFSTGVSLANRNPMAEQLMSGAAGMAGNVLGLFGGAFTIFGCLKMMKLQSRGISYAAVIFSMIPCLGSCCYLNLGVGIWALIVLSDLNVKASFES
jgi:hypothetical protein